MCGPCWRMEMMINPTSRSACRRMQPFIAEKYGYARGDFPVAESVSRRTIALPFYNHLTQDEVAIICGVLRGVLDACL